jgi:hypothetical protein
MIYQRPNGFKPIGAIKRAVMMVVDQVEQYYTTQ